jgi:hypothetical protein
MLLDSTEVQMPIDLGELCSCAATDVVPNALLIKALCSF